MEPIQLQQVVDEILNDFAVRIEEKHAVVEVGELPVIEFDRTQIRQLLQNLIGNALKFHKPGEPPQVRISAHLMKERRQQEGLHPEQLCQLLIEDHGIGMEPHHTERIFGMFKRLHGRDEYEGTGIGLAVCKKIVDRYGGKITVQSQLGQGSRFLITLPMSRTTEGGDGSLIGAFASSHHVTTLGV